MSKNLPTLDLGRYDDAYIETFLDRYEDFVSDVSDMAQDWPEMDERERALQRNALLPYWEKRTLLGALYRADRLSTWRVKQLYRLDQQLLEQAAAVELAYGPTLGELLRYLSNSGTPLTKQSSRLRVETTTKALIDLVGLAAA